MWAEKKKKCNWERKWKGEQGENMRKEEQTELREEEKCRITYLSAAVLHKTFFSVEGRTVIQAGS